MSMEVTAKGLRTRVREVLDCVDRGETVVVTYRGKPRARLVKIESVPAATATPGIAGFGMWKDRADLADVEGFVQNLRRPRALPGSLGHADVD